eukprot:TRINITY_DN45615_c0_g1_i1.p1 TRINITY_DN45615_c0_g1~~TRINITY_DN45615_c0_g1_i1.p1  ORF type:complete len:113 (-),score=16.94 TRINITY_DN45615_c0_g1_i1:60-398(-)
MSLPPTVVPAVLAMQSVLAILFSAAAVGFLSYVGLTSDSQSTCSVDDGYAWCAALRDLRSLMSFTLGVVTCCVFVSRKQEEHDGEAAEPVSTARSLCTELTSASHLALHSFL